MWANHKWRKKTEENLCVVSFVRLRISETNKKPKEPKKEYTFVAKIIYQPLNVTKIRNRNTYRPFLKQLDQFWVWEMLWKDWEDIFLTRTSLCTIPASRRKLKIKCNTQQTKIIETDQESPAISAEVCYWRRIVFAVVTPVDGALDVRSNNWRINALSIYWFKTRFQKSHVCTVAFDCLKRDQ